MLKIGDSGCGKTHGLVSLVDAGQKVRLLSAESNCLPVIHKALAEREKLVKEGKKKPMEEGQFAICVPERAKKSSKDFADTQEANLAKSVDMAFKSNPVSRSKYNRFVNICKAASHFVDSFTGVDYGMIDDWEEDTTFVVDSLSILCESIMAHVVGDKVAISQPEWGIMQGILLPYLTFLTEDIGCNFVLTAHPSKEIDPNLGVTRIYPMNLGQALNTKIPGKFSEVVWCYREEDKGKPKYYWSTDERLCVTRHTNLPCSKKIEQDFSLVFADLKK
jgi:hypothetical protein